MESDIARTLAESGIQRGDRFGICAPKTIGSIVRGFILTEFLPGERPDSLDDSTELITNRVLDSLGTLKLVAFLEDKFRIAIEPHETGVDYLNTLNAISALVLEKRK